MSSWARRRRWRGRRVGRQVAMNCEAFSAVPGAVATRAVTTSVIDLALQAKTSGKATNAQTCQFATQALGDMASIVGG